MKTLREWQRLAFEQATKSGFHDAPAKIEIFLINLHSEVSEAWEAYRGGKLNEPCDKAAKLEVLGLPILTCLEEELADVLSASATPRRRSASTSKGPSRRNTLTTARARRSTAGSWHRS